jgi:hypothetical protein
MNVAKAIELAMANTIREFAEMGEDVTIRAWQSLEADGSWLENPDRVFPMIDVRCGPPQTEETQATLQQECSILMGTKTDDDKSHAALSEMYEAVQGVCDELFSQFRSGIFTGEEIAFFLAALEEALEGDANFNFGGFTFGNGLAPADDNGINMIGITLVVHYSRSDF